MLTQPLRGLLKRQNNQCAGGGPCFDDDDTSYYDSQNSGFYNDGEPDVLRYVIVVIIILLLLLFVIGGIFHANRRMRAGKAPLLYHRWLVRRPHPRQTAHPYYGNAGCPPTQQYPMETWSSGHNRHMQGHGHYAPPPPVYSRDTPPDYQPPAGPPPGHGGKEGSPSMTVDPQSDGASRPGAQEAGAASVPRAPEPAYTTNTASTNH
ncbi:MAG: hypothetical protein M1831_000400 [Alyxoria varia]|nr:MAG: hypothetical protein M1831_000400 [Alyxoria varia]